MSYRDQGYDEFLTKLPVNPNQELGALAGEQLLSEFSGSKILGGSISSKDGKAIFDLENGCLKIFGSTVERVRIGQLEDGSYGLMIKDEDGNILMQISGEINFIQSSDGHTIFDISKNYILVKDENGNPRILLGYQDGGF